MQDGENFADFGGLRRQFTLGAQVADRAIVLVTAGSRIVLLGLEVRERCVRHASRLRAGQSEEESSSREFYRMTAAGNEVPPFTNTPPQGEEPGQKPGTDRRSAGETHGHISGQGAQDGRSTIHGGIIVSLSPACVCVKRNRLFGNGQRRFVAVRLPWVRLTFARTVPVSCEAFSTQRHRPFFGEQTPADAEHRGSSVRHPRRYGAGQPALPPRTGSRQLEPRADRLTVYLETAVGARGRQPYPWTAGSDDMPVPVW